MFGLTLRRVLFLHAHPDDETLAGGGLIAALVNDGVRVDLLTATRGERGEAVPGSVPPGADLQHVRLAEWQRAADALGIDGRFLLGSPPARSRGREPRSYSDSGMRWLEPGVAGPAEDAGADSLCAADLGEIVDDLVALVGATGPDLLISYESTGGYHHPDHIRMHRAASLLAERVSLPFAQLLPPGQQDLPGAVAVSVRSWIGQVTTALTAYRTQLSAVAPDHVVHVGGQRQDRFDTEYLLLPDTQPVPDSS